MQPAQAYPYPRPPTHPQTPAMWRPRKIGSRAAATRTALTFHRWRRSTPSNVKQLGFAWSYDLGEPQRGQEATPLVIDGVMYTSGTWGYVYAVDAATGKELWRYDPKADYFMGRNPCCDLVNRGVAVWKGKVFVASGGWPPARPGRGHRTKKLWEADTIVDHKLPYSSTGAPQIAGSRGGHRQQRRGHGSRCGARLHVGLRPGNRRASNGASSPCRRRSGQPYENPELAAADKTWDPHRPPQFKGGATAWDGFAYDAKLESAVLRHRQCRSLRSCASWALQQLDSLYATCIIAVDASTGRMAWYYQETPHDSWDYDAVQKMVLADITIDGAPRSVIMQASKNAFFYVLDRKTGKLLSAKNYAFMNWATHVDMKTGRPVTTPQSDWYNTAKDSFIPPGSARTPGIRCHTARKRTWSTFP